MGVQINYDSLVTKPLSMPITTDLIKEASVLINSKLVDMLFNKH